MKSVALRQKKSESLAFQMLSLLACASLFFIACLEWVQTAQASMVPPKKLREIVDQRWLEQHSVDAAPSNPVSRNAERQRFYDGISYFRLSEQSKKAIARKSQRKKARKLKKKHKIKLGSLTPPQKVYGLDQEFLDKPYRDKIFNQGMVNKMNHMVHAFQRVQNRTDAMVDFDYFEVNPFRDQRELSHNYRMGLMETMGKVMAEDHVRYMIRDADRDSAPFFVLGKLKGLMGGRDLFAGSEKEEKGIRKVKRRNDVTIKREDIVVEKKSLKERMEPLFGVKKEEEQKTPVKLKTKVNVVKRYGFLRLVNPIVETKFDLNMRAKERAKLRFSKRFRKLRMESQVDYGLKSKKFSVNMRKKITDRISCDVISEHNIDEERQEKVQLSYKLHF